MSDNEEFTEWHYRNTMKTVRFFFLDYRASVFIIAVLLHARTWTVALAITSTVVFWMFERRGLSFAAALRAIRVWIVGAHRPAIVYTTRRKLTDTGSE